MSVPAENWNSRALVVGWLMGVYLPPDRRLLERVILPWFANQAWCRRVLFVGVRFYVRHYPRLFRGREYVTIDRNPRTRWFGGPRHIVDSIEHVDRHYPAGYFDLVVLNGVLGWGIDDLDSAGVALGACERSLRPGGHFVVGANEARMPVSDIDHLAVQRGFERNAVTPLGGTGHRHDVRSPLPEKEHTYLFYRTATA
jgi:SAM-dependent methyltransferase